MLKKQSKLLLDDNSGVLSIRIFHLGKKKKTFKRASVSFNTIVKGTVINAEPNFKIKVGQKVNVIIVLVKRKYSRKNGCYLNFFGNFGIVLQELKYRKPVATKSNLTVTKEFYRNKKNKILYKIVTKAI